MILGSNLLRQLIQNRMIDVYVGEELQDARSLHIGPNSVDVRLAQLRSYTSLNPIQLETNTNLQLGYTDLALPYTIQPAECLLGCTAERFVVREHAGDYVSVQLGLGNATVNIVQEYHGRSTVGRLFLASHVTAAFGDVGFSSTWTLELVNHNSVPIRLEPLMRIGQVSFNLVIGGADTYFGSYSSQHNEPKLPVLGPGRF